MEEWNSPFSGEEIDRAVENGLHALRTDGATAMTDEQKSALLRQLMAVGVNAQEWSEGQKAQARRNIGAGEGTGGVIASATEPTDPAVNVWINTSGSAPVLYIRNTSGVWYPVPGLEGPAGPATGVNPNLLDNWYFAKPVNQRGQTTYQGVGYTIDRWSIVDANASLKVLSDGIELVNARANYITFTYQIENPAQYAGQTLTFSVLVKSISGTWSLRVGWASGTGNNSSVNITSPGVHSLTVTLPSSGVSYIEVSINPRTAAAPIILLAAKIEFSSNQTVGHQDNAGNWILNEIPNYVEQLARCQRFCAAYEVRNTLTTPLAVGYVANGNFVGQVPVPVSMRANPTISTIGPASFIVIANDSVYSLGTTLPSVYGLKNNQIVLRALNVGTTAQTAAALGVYGEANTISKLIFSADL